MSWPKSGFSFQKLSSMTKSNEIDALFTQVKKRKIKDTDSKKDTKDTVPLKMVKSKSAAKKEKQQILQQPNDIFEDVRGTKRSQRSFFVRVFFLFHRGWQSD